MSRARSLALQSIGAVLDRGAYSNIEASRALAGERLSEADRSLYKQLFYGVLERVIPLDYCIGRFSRMKKTSPALTNILRLGACQLLFLDRIPPRAAVDESVKLARRVAPQAAGFVNAVLRNIDRSRDGLLEELDRGGLSLKYSVHPAVAALLTDAYGHAATQAFFEGFTAQRSRICARVNTLRCSDASAFAAAAARDGITAEPGPLPDSVFLCFSQALEQTAAWRDGLLHLQGAASQRAAAAVGAKPGDTVLDACAAPGSKSFTMAQQMRDRGEIYAFDLHPHRVRLIEAGMRRLGIACIRPAAADAAAPYPVSVHADAALVDAPCSGYGMMARRPELRYRPPSEFAGLPALQRAILDRAAQSLRPGGRLVYSTCTLVPAENRAVTDAFLQANPGFSYAPCPRLSGTDADGPVTLFEPGSEGFYIAAIRREG